MDERLKQLINLGREHYKNREYDKAEKLLTQVLQENQAFADVYNMLGVIYHDLGQFKRAEECLERALQVNPSYTEAALNLAVTYNELGKYREAKEVYGKALASSKGQPRSLDPFARGKIANMHADLGDAYHGIGFYAEALREYRHALDLCPTFIDIRTRLANTFRDMGNHEEALRVYQEIASANPNYTPARLNLGVTLYSMKRVDEAIEEWRAVLEKDTENKSAKAYLKMVGATDDPEPTGPSGS